ncbi:MAG: MmgE/PrpD family protein [Promethearchaeota archaeon]|nr:MAG: MmgE/PrpD family protein [Candidatus Lokiarchaeota archaeon]
MEATKTLSEFVISTDFKDLPKEVIEEAKLCFFDWLGVALAGANDPEIDSLFNVIELVGGREQATILGKNVKSSILNATLINGMSSHVFDYDDTSVEFLGHASVTLFPSLLALSEWKGISGKDFLTAYIIGFEIGCQVAIGASANHALTGWHATSTIGHFSSTAGAAKLLGLTADQLIFAFGIAGTQAAGLKAVFGTSCKPFHPGKAGFNGLLAVLLAKRGFTSVKDILEGKNCFWDVYSSKWNAKRALKNLGKKWSILNNNYKFHASCYYTHAPIEAVLSIKDQIKKFNMEAIEKIEIYVSPITLENAGMNSPKTGLEGKFCVPYAVANALLREDTGMDAFTDEKVHDPEIIDLMNKIKVISDIKLAAFKAIATIYMDGESYSKEINIINQKLDYNIKKEEILKKFRSLVRISLKKPNTEEIIKRIENLEQESNMADLIKLIS